MKKNIEIFYNFLILGLISFGGPMAHIAYFRETFVKKLKWLDESSYARLIALSQFLPGPSSSQVGFAIGLQRGGLFGALLAFFAFTTPSFLLLYFLSVFNLSQNENQLISSAILGLKLFAVVMVADATFSMFRSFCKSRITFLIFVFSTIFLLFVNSVFSQIIVLIFAAIVGVLFIKKEKQDEIKKEKSFKFLPLLIFFFLLFFLPFLSLENSILKIISSFYEAGSLVFGGGHVVLPLLEQSLKDTLSSNDFLLGYSLAQAVPGPMFTIASYLGSKILSNMPFLGAILATISIFLPGFLLILAFYNSFETYTSKPKIKAAISAVNAAVVALLLSVLVDVVFPSAVYDVMDFIFVCIGLILLRVFKIPILVLILIFILFSIMKNFYLI